MQSVFFIYHQFRKKEKTEVIKEKYGGRGRGCEKQSTHTRKVYRTSEIYVKGILSDSLLVMLLV